MQRHAFESYRMGLFFSYIKIKKNLYNKILYNIIELFLNQNGNLKR